MDEAQQAHFQMCQVIGALRIEVRTGMSHSRGSVLKLAQERHGVQSRTKKGALEEMLALYKETYGWEYGTPVGHKQGDRNGDDQG